MSILTRSPKLAKLRDSYIDFRNGLDQLTPKWKAKDSVQDCLNFEMGVELGYQDIEGYERYDGQTSPSSVTYSILDVTISGSVSVGDTITGVTSSATAVVLAIVTSEDPDYLVVTKITGTFEPGGEVLNVSGAPEATSLGSPSADAASNSMLSAQYKNLAADEYRSDIAAVPGSGQIRGIWMLDNIVYAFRDNAGATACVMHKASTSGWVAIDLGLELSFTSGGTYEIAEGNTITGATSGATAVITRVVLESGSFSAGDAAGRVIFASQTGTFQAENLDVGGNLNVATIAGDSDAITMLPGGRFEFYNTNFGGLFGEKRIYGVDGVNRGFEFDGTVFVPIETGMSTDNPLHVTEHKNHLFFSYSGSAQHSGIGTPYIWSPVFGAAELATGDQINSFIVEPGSEIGGTLAILNANRVNMLYGSSSADWNLVKFRKDIGALPYTAQSMTSTFFFGDRGITDLPTTERFGNFQYATHSRMIQKFINEKKINASASCIARDKNQYRVFFSDGYGLYTTLNKDGSVMGMMPVSFIDEINCMFSLENNSEVEVIMFGSDNGFVYQLDKGTSFDGEPISAFLTTQFDFGGLLRWLKRYSTAALEGEGTGYAAFDFSWVISYGSSTKHQENPKNKVIDLTSAKWDTGETWDSGGFWDGQSIKPAVLKLTGSGENIAFTIAKNSDYFSPVRWSGIFYQFSLRRKLRN